MHRQRSLRQRKGSALLLCTLAATVLSMAAIAILRSGRQSIARVDSLRVSDSGRHVAEGFLQRSIALLQQNPNASGTVVDPANPLPGSRCELTPINANATQIRVFLYPGSSIPAVDAIVDPNAL